MNANEQYFPAVLFITLHKVALTVDGILKRDHWNEQYVPVVCLPY